MVLRGLHLFEYTGQTFGDLVNFNPHLHVLAWRHSGFSAHNAVRVTAEDAEGRAAGSVQLAQCMIEYYDDKKRR